MHFVRSPFLNSWFVLQIAEITPQPPSCPPPRGAEDEAENSPGAPEPHDQLQRCGKGTGGAGNCSEPGPAQAETAPERPRAAHPQPCSWCETKTKPQPEPWRINLSPSQGPVHIGKHRTTHGTGLTSRCVGFAKKKNHKKNHERV